MQDDSVRNNNLIFRGISQIDFYTIFLVTPHKKNEISTITFLSNIPSEWAISHPGTRAYPSIPTAHFAIVEDKIGRKEGSSHISGSDQKRKEMNDFILVCQCPTKTKNTQ